MKIPKISKGKIQTNEEMSVMVIDSIYNPTMESPDLEDEKDFNKFIKRIESIVRTSYEYKRYIKYLKTELNMKTCSFLPMVDLEEIKKVSLEFHHYPFTMYDIVAIIIKNKIMTCERNISPFLVANEVMECHYENIIGLIPLSKTVHDLAHSGNIFISLNQIFGNVKEFIKRYQYGITPELSNNLTHLIEMTNKENNYVPSILEKKITSIEVPNFGIIKKIKRVTENLA
jgi:hypothetical protein